MHGQDIFLSSSWTKQRLFRGSMLSTQYHLKRIVFLK